MQGQMSVVDYEAKFAELSRYSPQVIATEREKAKKLVEGLAPHIREKVAPLMIEYGDIFRRALVAEDTEKKHAVGQQASPKQKLAD